jgi:NlpC/P60 family
VTFAFSLMAVGWILMESGWSNSSVSDVLSGLSVPSGGAGDTGFISYLSSIGGGVQSGATPGSGGEGAIAPGRGGKKAVNWAKSMVGVKGGSAKVRKWDSAIGASPGIPWCSAFVSAALRAAGVTNLPQNPAYSGAWLSWGGGTHIKSLKEAKPGDLLIFDWGDGGITDHVALYIGHNHMISGNDSNDSVGISSVPAGNIVGIVRPKYPVSKTRQKFKTRSI